MRPRTVPPAPGWPDEVLAERVVTFTGPDAAVVRVRPRTALDQPGRNPRVWRATVLDADLRPIPVNIAVSQILAYLIRDHFRAVDWSAGWDYHVPERRLREPSPGTTLATRAPGICCGLHGWERVPA